jgi:hypothetical protein
MVGDRRGGTCNVDRDFVANDTPQLFHPVPHLHKFKEGWNEGRKGREEKKEGTEDRAEEIHKRWEDVKKKGVVVVVVVE